MSKLNTRWTGNWNPPLGPSGYAHAVAAGHPHTGPWQGDSKPPTLDGKPFGLILAEALRDYVQAMNPGALVSHHDDWNGTDLIVMKAPVDGILDYREVERYHAPWPDVPLTHSLMDQITKEMLDSFDAFDLLAKLNAD